MGVEVLDRGVRVNSTGERVYRVGQAVGFQETLCFIGKSRLDACELSPQLGRSALLERFLQASTRTLVKGAATDQDHGRNAVRIPGGKDEGQHCTPGLSHEGGLLVMSVPAQDVPEVRDMLIHG